jgi:malate synthase
MAEMLLRFEGLHLPNAHFLVDGFPMPAHIVTIALYLYHNWQPLQVTPPPTTLHLRQPTNVF